MNEFVVPPGREEHCLQAMFVAALEESGMTFASSRKSAT